MSFISFPKINNPEIFEEFCRDILNIKYNLNFNLYGRKGQKQDGIDIYSDSKDKLLIVAQCKNKSKINLPKFYSQITTDINSTENLNFKINEYIVMTTLDRDKNIQDFIIDINNKFSFKISIMFWQDFENIIIDNQNIQYKYFKNFIDCSEIPSQVFNNIISYCNTIKYNIQELNNYKGKALFDCQIITHDIYNHCLNIFKSVYDLSFIKNEWHLQLLKLNICNLIEEMINSVPDFHDASDNYVDIVPTVTNYTNYYWNDVNSKKFKNYCEEIIKIIEDSFI